MTRAPQRPVRRANRHRIVTRPRCMPPPRRMPIRPRVPTVYSYYDDTLPYGGDVIYTTHGPNPGIVSKSYGVWFVDRADPPADFPAGFPAGPFMETHTRLDDALRALVRRR